MQLKKPSTVRYAKHTLRFIKALFILVNMLHIAFFPLYALINHVTYQYNVICYALFRFLIHRQIKLFYNYYFRVYIPDLFFRWTIVDFLIKVTR